MNKKTNLIIAVVAALVLVGLFAYPKFKDGEASYAGNLPCLAPNLPLAKHWHPNLKVTIDGQEKIIPANFGLDGSCHRPLHTHDTTGQIHVESQTLQDYHLGEFLELWDEPMNHEGYSLEMFVNGAANQEFENLILEDKQVIELNYTKI